MTNPEQTSAELIARLFRDNARQDLPTIPPVSPEADASADKPPVSALEANGVKTASGAHNWHPATVSRIKRLAA